jgi:RNA polymerase sigma-70 factor (ECF subfamily)
MRTDDSPLRLTEQGADREEVLGDTSTEKKEKLSSETAVYTRDTESSRPAAREQEPDPQRKETARTMLRAPWTLSRGGPRVGDSSQPPRSTGMSGEPPPDEDRGLTFEQIHRKYQAKIFNLILRMVGDRDDAEDLTVETFVNAYRHWERFRGESRVSTWLHQIAVNNCKNRFKQRDRQRDRVPVSLDDSIETDSGELSREVADWTTAPERLLMDQELAAKIQEAVDALPDEYRIVLILAERDDLSYEEIAKITDLSVPAVKTRLHRARLKMRQRLEPYYRGWSGRNP